MPNSLAIANPTRYQLEIVVIRIIAISFAMSIVFSADLDAILVAIVLALCDISNRSDLKSLSDFDLRFEHLSGGCCSDE